MHPTKEKIARLNDKARKGLLPGSTKVLLTRMVAALPEDVVARLWRAVKTFEGFTEDNDPYREHDFGALELQGERYFWKIDYYRSSFRPSRARACTGAPRARRRLGLLTASRPSEVERLDRCVPWTIVAALLVLRAPNWAPGTPLFAGLLALGDHFESPIAQN